MDRRMFPEDEPTESTVNPVDAEPQAQGLANVPLCLIVLQGHEQGRKFPVDGGESIVGRSSQATVRLLDTSISKRHARLQRNLGEIVLDDLESTNGTFVNEERITRCTLRLGDKIRVG